MIPWSQNIPSVTKVMLYVTCGFFDVKDVQKNKNFYNYVVIYSVDQLCLSIHLLIVQQFYEDMLIIFFYHHTYLDYHFKTKVF